MKKRTKAKETNARSDESEGGGGGGGGGRGSYVRFNQGACAFLTSNCTRSARGDFQPWA